jgi:hypothetical protein
MGDSARPALFRGSRRLAACVPIHETEKGLTILRRFCRASGGDADAQDLIPKETREGETRVAVVPETVQRLILDGFAVTVEVGAGEGSMISDEALRKAGAELSDDAVAPYAAADLVLKLHRCIPKTGSSWNRGDFARQFLSRTPPCRRGAATSSVGAREERQPPDGCPCQGRQRRLFGGAWL